MISERHYPYTMDFYSNKAVESSIASTDASAFEIIDAKVGDMEEIVSLVNTAYWHHQRQFFVDNEKSRCRLDESGLKSILEHPDKKLFVLFDKTTQKIAGTILLELPKDKPHAKFGLFAVEEGRQGRNVGRELLDYVEEYARNCGRSFMKIEVFTFADKLVNHYKHLGYAPTGKGKSFMHADCIKPEYQRPQDRYLQKMRKELVTPEKQPVNEEACRYIAPDQNGDNSAFFQKMIALGKTKGETFESILSSLKESAPSCHRFEFKYPLADAGQAMRFGKVLQLKAREAHRFVPAIAFCALISQSQTGFIREIQIAGGGPKISENVILDPRGDRVIFIEEVVEDASSVKHEGRFAALNRVMEENGAWFFSGTYLYDSKPDPDKVKERSQMFLKTYENMISYCEKDAITG